MSHAIHPCLEGCFARESGDRTRRDELSSHELPLRDSAGISPDFAAFHTADYRRLSNSSRWAASIKRATTTLR
jgi:hypothetical protein